MNDLLLIGKIAYYLVFVFCLFIYAKYKYKNDRIKKFGLVALIIFGIIFGVYGIICGPPGESIGDRHNYVRRFETPGQEEYMKNQSIGLWALESIIQLFTRNGSVLFFVVATVFFVVNIYCYKKCKESRPLYLLLFFLSTVGLWGFFAMKQALSLAFANLAHVYYMEGNKKWAIPFLIVAILCHEAAWIVIPCLIAAEYGKKSKVRQWVLYIILFAIAIFYPQISKYFISLFSYLPGMDTQVGNYVDSSGSMIVDTNFFTIFKSAPYYIITIFAILYRKKLRDKIKNYDFMLVLSVFCSIFSVLSVYMYWMFRFATYFYLPCFLLIVQILEHLEESNRKILIVLIVSIMLGLMVKLLLQYYFIYGGII